MNIGSKSVISFPLGPVDAKFQVQGVGRTNHSSSQTTRLNDLSYGIKIWIDFCSLLLQSMRLTDLRTDRQTPLSYLVRAGVPCSGKKFKLCSA